MLGFWREVMPNPSLRPNCYSGFRPIARSGGVNGEVRVKLGASKDGSGLVLLDNNTEPGVALHAKDGGGAGTIAEGGKARRIVAE